MRVETMTAQATIHPLMTSDRALHFPRGLYGFDNERDFVVRPHPRMPEGPCLLLQSKKQEQLAFTILPLSACLAHPLTDEDVHEACETLGLAFEHTDIFLIVTLRRPDPASPQIVYTANMRAPLFSDTITGETAQYIFTNAAYETAHPLEF